MWRLWAKPSARNDAASSSSSSSSPFSFSTFKDIQLLCSEDSDPLTPRRSAIFHRARAATALLRSRFSFHKPQPEPDVENAPPGPPESSSSPSTPPEPAIALPGTESRIVVYFTSLRVVRPTFEDCQAVRSILRGFRVSIDERDLSMDSGFMEELQGILGQERLTLPRVFIGGRYVGGAEEVRQLHEAGELKKIVVGLPAAEPGVCDACGGYRFVLCDECNGSHKCYNEKGGGFRSCSACNENGLIRCPSCSCAPL
ncbi:uncharacterized protein At5g39865 [Malania oleifera]|uniref:uncharacterized protein At5g39865 n=1 Tax=Malania oleifera TaxID=397392 RepID=UPI0025AE90A7|nr:uncharacterized protein At5g39865 [Malania oleifera]